MSRRAHGTPRLAYAATFVLLTLAGLFPVALMVLNPTLMFERGWEQYVGTGIYFAAVFMLGRELLRLKGEERALAEGSTLVEDLVGGELPSADDHRVVPTRLRQLGAHAQGAAAPSSAQLMELSREASALDQERSAGRFTLTRYILYLLPVIGFIGTVEGISKALMQISVVLPMVKELDGFLTNLTGVTSALQIAFDSTLLALFLSSSLMLVQTLVNRRSEDFLARVDAWAVERVLPRIGRPESAAESLAPALERLRADLLEALTARLGDGFGPQVERFAVAVDRLAPSAAQLERGATAIGRAGDELADLGQAGDSLRKGVAALGRIEAALTNADAGDEQLEAIRRGIDRTNVALEGMAAQWAGAFERSSRATQEQLARTLGSLKDALDLLNVSIEQGNSLYRSIVKKMVPTYHASGLDEPRERAA